MRLSDVMTPNPKVVQPNTPLDKAAEVMKTYNVGVLPVSEGERLLGVITARDITMRATAEHRSPEQATVRNAMTTDVASCYEDQDVDEARRIMQEKRIRRLPVLDRNERLVGIVSLENLEQKSELQRGDEIFGRTPGGREAGQQEPSASSPAPSSAPTDYGRGVWSEQQWPYEKELSPFAASGRGEPAQQPSTTNAGGGPADRAYEQADRERLVEAGRETSRRFIDAINDTADTANDTLASTSDRVHNATRRMIADWRQNRRETLEVWQHWLSRPGDMASFWRDNVELMRRMQTRALDTTRELFADVRQSARESHDVTRRAIESAGQTAETAGRSAERAVRQSYPNGESTFR